MSECLTKTNTNTNTKTKTGILNVTVSCPAGKPGNISVVSIPPGVVPAYIHSDHKPAKAKHNNEYIIKTIFANTPPSHHLK